MLNKIIQTIKSFFVWQEIFFLGEHNLSFASNIQQSQLIQRIQKKIQDRKSFLGIAKIFLRKDFKGSVDGNRLFLMKRSSVLWQSVYFFEGTINEKNGTSYIYGRYKMKRFSKLFCLTWINFILFFFILIFIKTAADVTNVVLFHSNTGILKFDGFLFLFTLLVFLFGVVVIDIVRRIDNNAKALESFLSEMGIIRFHQPLRGDRNISIKKQ